MIGGRAVRLLVLVLALPVAAIWMPQPVASARPAPLVTWAPAGSPSKIVAQTRAAFLNNKVYVPGGWLNGFTTMFNGMQIYATSTGTWSVDNQPIPSGALTQSAVCSDGSKVYVLGGLSQATESLLATMQIYDPSKPKGSRWSTGPNIHTTATGDLRDREGGCAWIGGKLYLFGGDTESDSGTISGITDHTWVFRPATGIWSDTGFTMAVANWDFGYASNGANAFTAGGRDNVTSYFRDAEKFTPSSGWSAMTKLPVPKGATAGTGLEGDGLGFLGSSLAVFGGFASSGSAPVQTRTLVCALPCGSGDTWKNARRNLAAGRGEFAWASGGSTPTLYAIDGQAASGFVSTAEKTT